jgi:LysM repeat protein
MKFTKTYSLMPIFVALVMIFAVNLVIADTIEAQDRRTHVVRQGDTLFSISRQYDVTIEQIRSWNNLSGNQINLGQRLFVSAAGAPARTQEAPQPQTQPRPQPQPQQPAQSPVSTSAENDGEEVTITHRVASGETLFSLSRRYGVTVSDIKGWNNLSSELLEIGQVLQIKSKRQEILVDSPQTSRPDDSAAISSNRITSAYYVVRAGDTLTKIASDNSLPVEEIRNLNNLQSDRLSVGQTLLVRRPQGLPSVASGTSPTTSQGRFTSYEVARGERLVDILRKFEMTESEFVALNSNINIADIRPGLQISVLLPPSTTYKNPYKVVTASASSSESIRATRYNDNDRGRSTTNGDLYNPNAFTAAHNRLPLGSVVYLENAATGVGLFVLINDRIVEQSIKLSQAAFDGLGFNSSSDNSVIVRTTPE